MWFIISISWISIVLLNLSVALRTRIITRNSVIKMSSTINGNSKKERVLLFASDDSTRLKKAKLRLAEAQGVIPIGASDTFDSSDSSLKQAVIVPNLSKVREISWRVAEPSVLYDPDRAAKEFLSQPFKWLIRNIQIFIPVTFFVFDILSDILLKKEETNRKFRAKKLLDIISAQSPALIKAGQALASRSDLLPKEYLDSLQKLQVIFLMLNSLMMIEMIIGSLSCLSHGDGLTVVRAGVGKTFLRSLPPGGRQ